MGDLGIFFSDASRIYLATTPIGLCPSSSNHSDAHKSKRDVGPYQPVLASNVVIDASIACSILDPQWFFFGNNDNDDAQPTVNYAHRSIINSLWKHGKMMKERCSGFIGAPSHTPWRRANAKEEARLCRGVSTVWSTTGSIPPKSHVAKGDGMSQHRLATPCLSTSDRRTNRTWIGGHRASTSQLPSLLVAGCQYILLCTPAHIMRIAPSPYFFCQPFHV